MIQQATFLDDGGSPASGGAFACPSCGFDRYVDTPIHRGASTRRDCARCKRTAGFPVWYGAARALDTRAAAAVSIVEHAGSMLSRVLDFVRVAGERGATDEEIAAGVHLRESTARARRVELRDGGQVRDSGRTRATASGRDAIVWLATGKRLD